jgi:PAS domain S-box-containing protein
MTRVEDAVVNILLVDDRPENLLALEAVLASPGYRLVQAQSGKEALRALLQEEFALILLDVQMPEMDGFEAATLIRKREASKHIPIIFVTAIHQELSHILRGYEAGAVDYILKPIDPLVLKSKVAIFADLYRQKQENERKSQLLLREQAERGKLDAMRRHLTDVIDRLDHSIVWEASTRDMKFAFVSKRAEQILGYPWKSWFERAGLFLERVHPEDRPLVQGMLERTASKETDERCEHRMIDQSGKTLWFHTGVQFEPRSIQRDSPTFRGLSVEITPLKTAEEELRTREAKFRSVVDSNMIGHFFRNLDGEIHEANEYFLSMLGFSQKEVQARTLNEHERTPPEFRNQDQSAAAELVESGVCTSYEKELIAKDGRRVPVMIGSAMLEGSKSECVSFVMDLTEKRQEEEVKSRELRAREEILEIVSHDLKNPLGAILMNASLLFRRLPSEPEAAGMRKTLLGIQKAADRMKRLIEDLLDIAKLEAGKLPIQKKPCHLVPLLEHVIQGAEPSASAKSIELKISIPDSAIEVDCDLERIDQVFANLIGNAIKYSPKGGVIEIRARLEEREVIFEVIDSGSGIAPEDQSRVFEKFWGRHTFGTKDSGLGLYISKAIIQAHGGRIWLESKPGLGSKFSFSLPRCS